MNIKIHSIENKGDLDKEVVWLDVLEDCDLSYYMVCDSTYTSSNSISNEHRHAYWFSPIAAKKGDWIALHTKDGKNSITSNNNRGATTRHFYWNLGRTIWNKDGDCAVLFQLTTWQAKKA